MFQVPPLLNSQLKHSMTKTLSCYVICFVTYRMSYPRHHHLQDDDSAIGKKVKKVIGDGMVAVLCFGESQEE